MYELFHNRFMLHHNVCQHRVTVAIQMMWVTLENQTTLNFHVRFRQISVVVLNKHNFRMLSVTLVILLLYNQVASTFWPYFSPHLFRIVDAFVEAGDHFKLGGKTISEAVLDPETFLRLTGLHLCFS